MENCCGHNHNCIKELYQDHDKILASLDDLELAVLGNAVDFQAVQNFLDFTSSFSEPHHQKEELVLFPKLEEKGIPNEGGPIGAMLIEHVKKRMFVKDLAAGLEAQDSEKIKENSKNIISLMRDHIYKENNILYPCAEDVISLDEMALMGEKCSKIN